MELDYLWGEKLKAALSEVRPVREPLIEGFLYKKSAHMIWAPDGAGKSFVTLQAAIQGTVTDGKVYGDLHVPQGFNTLYLQAERDKDESLERMKRMVNSTPFDAERFTLSTDLQDINLRNEKSFEKALVRVEEIISGTFKALDLFVIDPIYSMVRGGLKDDEGASYITEFSRLIQKRYGCSILLVHHANRGSRDKESGARIGEDMFGSRFLSAHCTGVYKLNLKADKTGTTLSCEKSSNENLEERIELRYDPETHLSFSVDGDGRLSKTDLLHNYLRTCKANKKTFNFNDMLAVSKVSTSFLRGHLSRHLQNGLKIVGKSKHGTNLYEWTGTL